MVEIGKLYRTPFEPRGTVRVDSVRKVYEWPSLGREIAAVTFIGDHPHGYKDGDRGNYYADELTAIDNVHRSA